MPGHGKCTLDESEEDVTHLPALAVSILLLVNDIIWKVASNNEDHSLSSFHLHRNSPRQLQIGTATLEVKGRKVDRGTLATLDKIEMVHGTGTAPGEQISV